MWSDCDKTDVFKIETLTIAIIIGILYNNTIGTQAVFKEGITFSLRSY